MNARLRSTLTAGLVGAMVFAAAYMHHRPRAAEAQAAWHDDAPGTTAQAAPQKRTFAAKLHDTVNRGHRGLYLGFTRMMSWFGGTAQAQSKGEIRIQFDVIHILEKPILFDQERKDLTLAYRRQHQDPKATDIAITPKMIILHHTAISSFDTTWKYFNNVRAEAGRTQLAGAGDVNVSAQFVVDRDGTIYRLMPETWMARHCIGLNHVAIGIENVGDNGKFPLTDAQVEADAALVRYLKGKYPAIDYLIGHQEYRKMEGTPLFVELDPKYRNQKPDPATEFLVKVRERVKNLELKGPPAGS